MAQEKVTCEKCGGTGKVSVEEFGYPRCPACHGSGFRSITVDDLRKAHKDGFDSGNKNFRFPESLPRGQYFLIWLKENYGIEEEK